MDKIRRAVDGIDYKAMLRTERVAVVVLFLGYERRTRQKRLHSVYQKFLHANVVFGNEIRNAGLILDRVKTVLSTLVRREHYISRASYKLNQSLIQISHFSHRPNIFRSKTNIAELFPHSHRDRQPKIPR